MSETDDSEQDDREQIHLWVSSDHKSRWKNYVDDAVDVSSVSDLIRTATSTYVAVNEGQGSMPTAVSSESSGVPEHQLTEVLEATTRLETKIDDVQQRLSVVEEETSRSDTDLADTVFAALPSVKPHPDNEDYQLAQVEQSGASVTAWSGTVEELTQHIHGEQPPAYARERIQDALDRLQSDTSMVRSIEVDDETRYWKETE